MAFHKIILKELVWPKNMYSVVVVVVFFFPIFNQGKTVE